MRTDILQQAQAIRASMDAAAGAAQIAGQVPVATAGLFAPALPAWEPGPKRSNQYLKRGIAPTGVIYMHIR